MRLVQELYERHKGIFYRVARARAADEAEVDDLISEALLRLFRHAETLRGLREWQQVDYIADTVQSVAGDFARKRRSEARRLRGLEAEDLELPDLAPGPEEGYLEREARTARLRALREALLELGETDRTLLVGKYLNGESDEDLARRIGVRPASVRMKLTRARQRARALIQRKEAGHGGA